MGPARAAKARKLKKKKKKKKKLVPSPSKAIKNQGGKQCPQLDLKTVRVWVPKKGGPWGGLSKQKRTRKKALNIMLGVDVGETQKKQGTGRVA